MALSLQYFLLYYYCYCVLNNNTSIHFIVLSSLPLVTLAPPLNYTCYYAMWQKHLYLIGDKGHFQGIHYSLVLLITRYYLSEKNILRHLRFLVLIRAKSINFFNFDTKGQKAWLSKTLASLGSSSCTSQLWQRCNQKKLQNFYQLSNLINWRLRATFVTM